MTPAPIPGDQATVLFGCRYCPGIETCTPAQCSPDGRDDLVDTGSPCGGCGDTRVLLASPDGVECAGCGSDT